MRRNPLDAVLAGPAGMVRDLLTGKGRSQAGGRRPVRTGAGRAHLRLRGVHRPGRDRLAAAVEEALEAVAGVQWAAVNPILGEVMVAFEDGQVSVDDLSGVIDGVEDAEGVLHEEFLDLPPHPADPRPLQRGMVALMADGAGIGFGAAARILRLPMLPVEIASAIPAVDSLPPVRRLLEARPAVETATVLTNAVLQGLGQGPLGLMVDAAHRVCLQAELVARRRAWLEAEETLHPGRPASRPGIGKGEGRPRPRPPGLVDDYSQWASLSSLVGAGVALAATRDPRRGADMILAGMPRAARVGVDGFAAQLGRHLADRGIVAMDPRALRRLDLIDTVVFDTPAVTTGAFLIEEVMGLNGAAPDALEATARTLFDPQRPEAVREGGGWVLAPQGVSAGRWPRGSHQLARDLRAGGSRILQLTRDGTVRALVAVRPEPAAGVMALVEGARGAGCSVVVAGAATGLGPVIGADRTVPGGDRLARSVRVLQDEGRVVALVSARPGAALRVADCGVGLLLAGAEHPPWGAHLLCPDVHSAAAVMEAIPLARSATRRSVACAAAGSTVAALLAVPPGPGAGRRAVTAVQLSSLAALTAGTWTATQLSPALPPPPAAPVRWDTLDPAEVLRRVDSGPGGLTGRQAAERTAPRPEPRVSGMGALIVSELTNPLSLILGAGAALSAAVGSVVDATLIGAAVTADSVLGAAQRVRTEAAIGRLASAVTAGQVTVIRDGRDDTVDGRSLVVGDVIRVAAGDAVAADCRLLDSVGVETDESSLTGESLPVTKDADPVGTSAAVADRRSMIYAGTAVAAGRATAVVVATGDATEARRGRVDGPAVPSGVQTRLRALTDLTVPLVLISGAGLTLNALVRGRPAEEAVASGVSLAAAAVPEGLPFVATVAQAGAAHRLAGRGVLVRNPAVLEALGRVDVLCFDKTGTLTEGKLSLRVVSDGSNQQAVDALDERHGRVLAAALRASPRPRGRTMAHPTDQAVVDGAGTARVRPGDGAPGWQKGASLPFEPGRAYHAVLGRGSQGSLLSVKGAPEALLPRCAWWRGPDGRRTALDTRSRAGLEAEVDRLARQGLRVLAVAERADADGPDLDDARVDGLDLVGLVGVADTARPTAAVPLEQLRQAGIGCVMVTGDHPSTAEAIATDLGLLNGRRVITGPQLEDLDDEELTRIVGEVGVFARVTPADKVRIVSAFQRSGRVVAMTGDGANDAQAIRMAEIGVAFGPRATGAARDAADLVVVPEDLSVLIEAIVEGRAMWASVRDALSLLLGGNLGEVVFTSGAALLTGRTPLTARQLLAVNLFTDLAPAMALAASPPRSGRIRLDREGPETSLAGPLARDVAVRASATAGGTFAAWTAARLSGTPTRARTVALATLVGTQLGQTLVAGRRSPLVAATSVASAATLLAVIQVPGVSHFFDCRPLGPVGWTIVATASGLSTASAVVANALLS